LGFHAQQAAEKYLKAHSVHHQIEFPKTHDLDMLLDLAEKVAVPLANLLRDVTMLTIYGVETQYPADLPDLTLYEAQKTIVLATQVRAPEHCALER
jgi:HEPN domain-containing protein